MLIRKLKNTILVCFTVMVSSCQTWDSWTPERSGNDNYKAAGYGYYDRYYTVDNINYIGQNLQASATRGELKNRDEIHRTRHIFIRSKNIAEYRNVKFVENYINDYRTMLQSEAPKNKLLKEGAPEEDYFSPFEYVRYIPKDNIKAVTSLYKSRKLSMTKSSAKEINRFYKKHKIDGDSTIPKEIYYDYNTTSAEDYGIEKNYNRNASLQTGLEVHVKGAQLHSYFLESTNR